MLQTKQISTYVPEIQKRLLRHCSRYGIRCDMVTFLGAREIKIKCGRQAPTLQAARAALGYIPYVFRRDEGLNGSDFEYRFEGKYCFITFRKLSPVRIPERQKKLQAYFVEKYVGEIPNVVFIDDFTAKVPYGNLTPSKWANGELLRKIPYAFRFLEKLFNLPTTYDYREDGYCYITFKK